MHQFDPDTSTDIALEVIDATLAGEAVEPEHAELAELTLILAGQRPAPSTAFTAALDERVARRFAAPAPSLKGRRTRRSWLFAPGAAVGLAAVIAVVIVVGQGHNGSSRNLNVVIPAEGAASQTAASAGRAYSAPARPIPTRKAAQPLTALHGKPPALGAVTGSAVSNASASSSAAASSASGTAGSSAPFSLNTGGASGNRQIIQSAQLALSAKPNQIDNVSQQVFNVVAAEDGVVNNSNVTATNNASGYAQFELSVPSQNLSQTMSQLSKLRGANVVSRTDATQDITGQVGAAGQHLAEARTLRTALLKQLAAATTQTQIDSLKIQIRDADASIASDQATLNTLHHKVDNSTIYVSINAQYVPGHPVSSGGGFTLGKAAHDAGRVLVTVAGVGLITLAVLVPIGMVAAVIAWVGFAIRRRRREHALDLV
jgi:hypothetical protein